MSEKETGSGERGSRAMRRGGNKFTEFFRPRKRSDDDETTAAVGRRVLAQTIKQLFALHLFL